MKNIWRYLTAFIIIFFMLSVFTANQANAEEDDYIKWLEVRSMLYQARQLEKGVSGKGIQWRHPYAKPQPDKACETAPAWFTAYPAATITRQGESIIQTLGSEKMWETFQEIGIQAMHPGPLKRAGGITGRKYTPTVDGGFDRISLNMDPLYGTDNQYIQMVKTAAKHSAVIIADVIPGHTGKGADFRLAEQNYRDYPGIYYIVEIKKEDWKILPDVAKGHDTVNLQVEAVEKLKKKGYIVGQLQRVIFYEPGVKDTNWSATGVIKGVDGKDRRWVYLHYFKTGQPTLNWLDPSFGADRLLAGDIIQSVNVFGVKFLRLDANGFLGVEIIPGKKKAWSEGHPLSVNACDMLAMMTRKLGGFTFQELNLSIGDIKWFSENGPDLSYDFITRPAFCHAMITGDAEFLRLCLHLMKEYEIKPISLIHAMQNHDEITYELVHFSIYADKKFKFHGKEMKGSDLRNLIIGQMKSKITGKKAPYNKLSGNGLCTTMVGLCSASLNIKDPYKMTPVEKEKVKNAHLLMVIYNAMQPGVFAISGWDLVGALPLHEDQIKEKVADGDYRWVNRGAYDLMGVNPGTKKSLTGLPCAQMLYGTLPDQLKDKNSFASKLKKLLAVRKKYKIHISEQIAVPTPKNTGVVIMIHKLPGNDDIEITAVNFGRKPADEKIKLDVLKKKSCVNLISGKSEGKAGNDGVFELKLRSLQGKVLLFR